MSLSTYDTKFTSTGMKNLFRQHRNDFLYPVVELVANGFDASASEVQVRVDRNEMGGVELISIFDNGRGIDISRKDEHFGRFNESRKGGDVDLQGSQGRGGALVLPPDM